MKLKEYKKRWRALGIKFNEVRVLERKGHPTITEFRSSIMEGGSEWLFGNYIKYSLEFLCHYDVYVAEIGQRGNGDPDNGYYFVRIIPGIK
jgi:hypothetical protein